MKKTRRFLSLSLTIVVIIAQLTLPLSRALAPAPSPPRGGVMPQPPPDLASRLPPDDRPLVIPVSDDAPPAPEKLGVTKAEPLVVTQVEPPVATAPRQTLTTPFGTGNNNYGQTQRDTDNPQNHPGHHFAGSVNLVNGNLFLTVGDFFIPGRGLSLQLARSYNSLAAADGEVGAFGYGWRHSYETHVLSETGGITLTVVEADGARHDYHSPQPCGSFTCYESPPGLYRQLRLLPGGYQLLYKNGTTQQFDAQGRLIELLDRHGNAVTLTYSPDCFTAPTTTEALCRITDASGQRGLQFFYDESSGTPLVVSAQEWLGGDLGREILYAYEGQNLVGLTYPEGGAASYVYDGQHRMTGYDDPRQPEGVRQAELIQYDDDAPDPQDRVRRITYDSFFDVFVEIQYDQPPLMGTDQGAVSAVLVTDGEGQQSRVEFDDHGNVVYEGDWFPERSLWVGKWWWWWPNRWWLLWRKVDANLHVTAYDYDAWGNTQVVTNALGLTQRYLWEAPYYETEATFGNVLSATNSLGVTTRYEYLYDPTAGDVMTEVQAAGTPAEAATVYESDRWGQLARQVDGLGHVTAYGYDLLGNTDVITDARGSVTRNAFDPVGRPITTTDQAGHATAYEYDPADRLLWVRDPNGGTTRYTYSADGRDNLVQLVNANGVTTTFVYDSLDQLLTQTNSLGQTTGYAYDKVGRLVRRTDADGRVTRYEYDPKSRMTRADYYEAGATEPYQTNRFRYDGAGNLVGMSNANVRLAYRYDPLDQRTGIDMWTPSWGVTRTLELERASEAANLTRVAGPGGYQVQYRYDELNRLTDVTDPFGGATAFVYDPLGRETQAVYPDGTVADYGYGETHQLTRLDYALSAGGTLSYTYAYDGRGNPTREVDEGEVYTYTYDAVGRVVSTTGALQGEVSFEYDAVGNRLRARGPESDAQFVYDAHNRLLQAGGTSFAHNQMGARTQAQAGALGTRGGLQAETGTRTETQTQAVIHYRYDNDMRLLQVDPGLTFLYDPLGNLIGTLDAEGDYRYFLRDGEDVYLELDGNGDVLAQYVVGPDGVFSMWRAARRYLFLGDGRGRVRRVLDLDTGAVVTRYGTDLNDPGQGLYLYNPIRVHGAWWFPEVRLALFGDGVFWDPWYGVFLAKAWPWLYWPFGPFHPWRPIFRFWPWPWPWARPWGWPWPRPWPFLWPWPGAWVRPWVIWPFWPWGLRPWWPWWYWRGWWGWTWWGHWWCWRPWWWWGKWWWWPWWQPWWWWGYWWFPWYWWWSCWWWPAHWWWWIWWQPWWWGGWNWWCWWWWWPWRWWWWWPWRWPPLLGPPEVGDAPDPPYASYRRNRGATHGLWWYEWLGASRDGEWDSEQVDADLYDDGVAVDLVAGTLTFTPTVASPGSARYAGGTPLHVHGWFDWNGDGDWDDAGEWVVDWSGYPGDGLWPLGQQSLGVTRPLTIPDAVFDSGDVAELWARFRLDYAANHGSPLGYTRFGEVEDHRLTVVRPHPPRWADGLAVSPLAPLVVTYTRVVTGVAVSVTPTLALTPTWSGGPAPLALGRATAGGYGARVTLDHAPFAVGQRYTVTLGSGRTLTGTEVVLPGGFSFTAGWAASLYLPLILKR